MRRTLIIGSVATVALLAGLFSYQLRQQEATPRSDFVLQNLQGEPVSAQNFDGQLVLLNFWAPWCAPCRAEIPMLNELQTQYGKQGLQILGPAVDQEAAVQDFVQKTPIRYPVLLGMTAVMRLQDSYGEQALPFSVLISRQGQIIYKHAGELKRETIEPIIRQNL
ncbi:MAG: TlpA disulfide reductase family protein [Salinisphaeraceae bacterium]|nr:TlpA disulfide reductase family protein [Salinisphaeraceae bacterium]